jgi:autotransporter adhesin
MDETMKKNIIFALMISTLSAGAFSATVADKIGNDIEVYTASEVDTKAAELADFKNYDSTLIKYTTKDGFSVEDAISTALKNSTSDYDAEVQKLPSKLQVNGVETDSKVALSQYVELKEEGIVANPSGNAKEVQLNQLKDALDNTVAALSAKYDAMINASNDAKKAEKELARVNKIKELGLISDNGKNANVLQAVSLKDAVTGTRVMAVKNASDIAASIVDSKKHLHKVDEKVKAHNSTLSDHDERITSNTKGIEANKAGIAKNVTRLDAHDITLGKHDKRITSNAKGIKENKAAISGLRSDFDAMAKDYNSFKKQTNGAIAGMAAMSNIPQPYSVGKSMIGAGVGHYNGESAISVGMGYRYSESVTFKASVASSTGEIEPIIGAGVGYEF